MKAIVYTSNTGFTARYAKMLGEETGLPVVELAQANTLEKGTPVIYMGWLFAGTIKGYAKAAKRFDVKAVVGVGMCETGTLLEEARKTNRLPEALPLFTVQGGMDHSKLRGVNKFMINTLIKVMSGQKNPSEDDKKKLALIREGGDHVCKENLTQVLQWFGEQEA